MPLSMWKKTKIEIGKLEALLKCNACGNSLKDPCSINSCDHSFCRVCATESINTSSKCPECGSFAWLKDIQTNRQLTNVVEFCNNLKNLIKKDFHGEKHLDENTRSVSNYAAKSNLYAASSSCELMAEVTSEGNEAIVECSDQRDGVPHKSEKDKAISKPISPKENLHETCEREGGKDLSCLNVEEKSPIGNGDQNESEQSALEIEKEKDQEENLYLMQNEMCPSWPCSTKKSKKTIKTYSNLRYTSISKKPRFNTILRKPSSNSDSDFENPVRKKSNSVNENDLPSSTTVPVSEQGNDLFVYDEDKVLEIENEFFHQKVEQNDDISSNSYNSKDMEKRRRPVTRLRKKEKLNNVLETSGCTPKKTEKTKGLKRKNSSAVSEAPSTHKRKSNDIPSIKRNKKGETPLHVAAIKGNYDTAKKLLENGADPNIKDFAGWTPLHEACNHGRFEIVQLLLDNGAFIDIPGCDHDTPLHDAIANNRLEVAEFLISNGASLDVRNKQGMLPMDYVRSTAAKEQILMAASIAQENKGTRSFKTSVFTRDSNDKPKCILYSGLNTKEKKSLEKCVKNLSGEILDKFDERVTHIVTSVDKDNVCPRTMKNLLGILTGKWIVSTSWVDECLKKKTWLNEDDFEVKGCSEGNLGSPKKARLNSTKQFPALFDGCSFYLSGEFQSTPSRSEVLQIIKLGGGKLLHREPKVETAHPLITPASPAVMKMMSSESTEVPTVAYHAKSNTAQSHCTQYIIFDKQSMHQHKRISSPILCTASTSWIMECISRFEIVEVKDF